MKFADPAAPIAVDIAGGGRYWLRVPTVADRASYRRAVAAANGVRHPLGTLLRELRRGIVGMAEAEGAPPPEAAIAAVDAQLERLEDLATQARAGTLEDEEHGQALAAAAELLADGAEALEPIAALVRRHWMPYREMLADNEVYVGIASLEAARLFVIGWEKIGKLEDRAPMPFGPLGMPETLLRRIPELHLPIILAAADGAFAPSEAEAKNSESPRPGSAAATTSSTTGKRRRKTRS